VLGRDRPLDTRNPAITAPRIHDPGRIRRVYARAHQNQATDVTGFPPAGFIVLSAVIPCPRDPDWIGQDRAGLGRASPRDYS